MQPSLESEVQATFSKNTEEDFLIKQAKKLCILDKDELLIRSLQTRTDSAGRLRDGFNRMIKIPEIYKDIQKERSLARRRATYHKKKGNLEKYEENLQRAIQLREQIYGKVIKENNQMADMIINTRERQKMEDAKPIDFEERRKRRWVPTKFQFAVAGVAAVVAGIFEGTINRFQVINTAVAYAGINKEVTTSKVIRMRVAQTEDGIPHWKVVGLRSTEDRINMIDDYVNKSAQKREKSPNLNDKKDYDPTEILLEDSQNLKTLVELSLNRDRQFETTWERLYGN
jgi:hypothetical protein